MRSIKTTLNRFGNRDVQSQVFKTLLLLIILCLFSFSVQARSIYRTNKAKSVALTFDDGPTLGVTDKILDILKKENVRATFFVIGKKVENNPKLILRMKQEGQVIGNHTYSHTPITWINNVKVTDELKMTKDLVCLVTSQEVFLFRPPHGRTNKSKDALIEKLGYTNVFWSVNADDFLHSDTGMRTPNSIAKRVLSRVKGNDIILMHDNSQQIVDALPMIIKELKKRKYSFVTIGKQ